jgi:osmoprotectant transport system ATP-binding protein
MTNGLTLERVFKSFKSTRVLDNISLVVPTGATHALIGPSGSGKTTLLRITLGLIPLDKGYVKINEQPLSSFTPREWAGQIGYVPQEGGLFPHLTAKDNVTLIARLRRWTKPKLFDRVNELSALVELAPSLLDKFPHELSGGQRQRMAIMRAAFLNPPVLLLDEPMGALDPLVRQSLQQEFKSIFKKLNKTVVIVTHDLSEAVFLADDMTLRHEGRIIQTGHYKEFLKNPADPFVTLFINAHRSLPEI